MSILKFKGGEPSQNGERGIIDEVIKRIKPKNKTAVEFGAPTKQYCSNIFHLIDQGWTCHYYDSDPREEGITQMFITPENINDLPKCTIWSCDVDGIDYTLFGALKTKPDVIIIEINSSLDPNEPFYSPEKGSSFCGMNALASIKGYFLLCHTGNNIYLLNKHKDKFPDADETFNTSWL